MQAPGLGLWRTDEDTYVLVTIAEHYPDEGRIVLGGVELTEFFTKKEGEAALKIAVEQMKTGVA